MSDLVIISMHEKGFWQADLYADRGEILSREFEAMSPAPDGFFTMKKGLSLAEARKKAKLVYPNSIIKVAADDDLDDDE